MSRGYRSTRGKRATAVSAVIVASLLIVPIGASAATTVSSVTGSAYGVQSAVNINGISGSLGPKPSAAIPPTGGSDSATLGSASATIGLVSVLQSATLQATSNSSGVGGNNGNVVSEAEVEDLSLIDEIVQADLVTASCSADANGVSGSTALVGATVSGIGSLSASPAPNTKVNIANVGTLWLNRQTTSSSGVLTVTALQLDLDLDLLAIDGSGTIRVARAVCGAATSSTQSTTTTSQPATTTTTADSPTTTKPKPAPPTTSKPTTTTSVAAAQITTSTVVETTTTHDEDACWADGSSEDDTAAILASQLGGPGADSAAIGDSNSAAASSRGTLSLLNGLLLLVVASVGALGGYLVSRLSLFGSPNEANPTSS